MTGLDAPPDEAEAVRNSTDATREERGEARLPTMGTTGTECEGRDVGDACPTDRVQAFLA